MFDVGFWELALIGVIALLVLGPERLPKAARTAGMWAGRARRMLREVKSDIDREIRASELAELQKVGKELKDSSRSLGEGLKETGEGVSRELEEASREAAPAAEPGKGRASGTQAGTGARDEPVP
jgi:sec-independent protein translocase protein TatB